MNALGPIVSPIVHASLNRILAKKYFGKHIYIIFFTWSKLVAPDVVDVAALALVRHGPKGEALVEGVGLLVDQLQTFSLLRKIFLVSLQGQSRLVNVCPALKRHPIKIKEKRLGHFLLHWRI